MFTPRWFVGHGEAAQVVLDRRTLHSTQDWSPEYYVVRGPYVSKRAARCSTMHGCHGHDTRIYRPCETCGNPRAR